MKLNKEFIKQLRNGEIAAENNGTLEQLREVIEEAFPGGILTPDGTSTYYKIHRYFIDKWLGVCSTNLPTKPISEFYEAEIANNNENC